MPEPLTNVEIEDVLSSIRRLVTEDVPPRTAHPAPLGKLLLTPAQRVSTPKPSHDDAATDMRMRHEFPATQETDDVTIPPPFQVTQHRMPTPELYDRLAPIDEEVLHELVRELLTEELQGPFGERITRNIRKLVRAEIGKALAARDLD